MARSDRQLSYEERYKEKMEKYKEAYKVRTDFASKFKLDLKKTKGLTMETIVNHTERPTGNTGSAEKPEEGNDSGTTFKGGNESAQKVIDEAIKWVGKVTYVFGAATPQNGRSDCSGYTSYVFKQALGMNLPRTTTGQANLGTKIVPRDKALPGDIIMFQGTYRPGPSHVGIVLDWPKIVHCGSSKGVAYAEVKDGNYYDQHFLSIRRVISDNGKDEGSESKKPSAKALSFRPMDETTDKDDKWPEVPDDYGMEQFILNGMEPTTNPGAPIDSIEPPLSWYSVSSKYNPIKVYKQAQSIRVPKMNRAMFFHQRIKWGADTGYKQFKKLDPEHFIHLSRHDGFEGNLYSPDAIEAFEIFRLKSKREKLEILSGFRFSPQGLISPHEAGCAIDVRVYGYEDARKLADIAWACGFRSIAVGGDIESGGGFIHLDIGPKNEWGYDNVPVYQGPGRWNLDEV